eukprot:CAMPEP_0181095388 /NCGR_PEP_ID=MMETSP1071-20121207/10491_1 /TAXON_ID=35127 /ORGANISM="Thalassiosira sp., Strain NH16" /LENGTH=470 /DNA_ID=CAMNT_0023177763 /DNA_START=133 /DNA_END=1545 /DNA_ORIENTATION=+
MMSATQIVKLAPSSFHKLQTNSGRRVVKSSLSILARKITHPRQNAPFASVATPASQSTFRSRAGREPNNNLALGLGAGGAILLAGLHSATGSADDFYDYRFKSNKDPDDLASFYGGEELMELFCVFPIVGQIMMRYAHFDETGNVITTGFPGQMKVSMVFSDEVNDETGATDWFNKRERFRNTLFGYTCWDMVLNFGFRTLEDGSIECYHFGEYFHGNLPFVSQAMLLIFKVHARWVAWATEHHINHYAFALSADTNDDDEENTEEEKLEEYEEYSRSNMPLFLLNNYAWSDLTAMLFGYRKDVSIEKQPSFLVTGRESEKENTNKDEEDESDKIAEVKKLPFQQEAIQKQISEDIASDKQVMKELLARHETRTAEDVKTILARRHTINMRNRRLTAGGKIAHDEDQEQEGVEDEDLPAMTNDVYVLAKDLAVNRAMVRRLTRQRTYRAPDQSSPSKAEVHADDTAVTKQ